MQLIVSEKDRLELGSYSEQPNGECMVEKTSSSMRSRIWIYL